MTTYSMSITRFLLLWLPILTLFLSIYLIMQGSYQLVAGLVALAVAIDGLINLKVHGMNKDYDERSLFIVHKSADLSYRITCSVVIVLAITHFVYSPLDASFLLVFILLVMFVSSVLSKLYIHFKY